MGDKNSESSLIPSLNIFTTIGAFIYGMLSLKDQFSYEKLVYITLVVILLYLIINHKRLAVQIKKITSRIQIFLNIIVEYRRGHLEFLDPYGVEAMYHEEILLNKIRKKIIYEGSIEVDGKIDNKIHTYNCFNSINEKNDKLTIIYGNKKDKENVVSNGRQLQFGFAVTFHNSFSSEKESWESTITHYTRVYDLRVSFSKKNPPKNIEIFQVFEGTDGNTIVKPLPIDPLILKKYNRVIMKVKLLHLNKGDSIRVTWDWKKKSKKKSHTN